MNVTFPFTWLEFGMLCYGPKAVCPFGIFDEQKSAVRWNNCCEVLRAVESKNGNQLGAPHKQLLLQFITIFSFFFLLHLSGFSIERFVVHWQRKPSLFLTWSTVPIIQLSSVWVQKYMPPRETCLFTSSAGLHSFFSGLSHSTHSGLFSTLLKWHNYLY